MATELKKCDNNNCKSVYQDAKYGKGVRVHNTGKKGTVTTHKCTVCGNKK